MRRVLLTVGFVFVLMVAVPVMAQDVPADPVVTDQQDFETLTERAESAAERAEESLAEMDEIREQAQDAVSYANDLFGHFEILSGIVGMLMPLLALVAGILGFYRLQNASDELREARERFEQDMQRRQEELDGLRDELQNIAHQQREDAAKASLALALLPLGERQYRAQDYAGALDTYKRALELDRDNPITHYRLGYVYTQSGELSLAQQHLSRSLELDADFAPSRAALGYVYRRMGDKLPPGIERDQTYNRAEEQFLAALDASHKLLDEDSESWWGSLGGLYRRRGQVEQAIRAYEACADVTPHSSYPFSNLALLYAQTHNRKKMLQTYQRVEQLAREEIRAQPDNYWAMADLVTARLALGKHSDMPEIVKNALDIAPPDSPYTLDSLLDTLDRLAVALDPPERPPVAQAMEMIRQFKAQQQSRRLSEHN